MLDDKVILITGGTGTIGTTLIKYIFKHYYPNVIRILSRDETKQHILKNDLGPLSDKARFFIGDIRDKDRLERALKNVDIVFHLAALKHVLACEYNPFEAIKTNVIGLQNLIEVSINNQIEKFIFTSSDKAATPCNSMGVTKLLGEKLVTAANYYKGPIKSIFYSVRFGNVLGSRGSLIPLIEQQVMNDSPITLTDKNMTRYIMTNDMAIELIIETLKFAQGGEVFVPKMNKVKIIELIEVLVEYFSKKYNKNLEKIEIEEIGMFAGEKLYEELFSIEESNRTYEFDEMYVILPQITEVKSEIDFNSYPNIRKFDNSRNFNSKEGSYLSKEDLIDFLDKYNLL